MIKIITYLTPIFPFLLACNPTYQNTPQSEAEMADTVLTNGKIYTVNPQQPWAEAIAIKDGRYSFVGASADALSFVGKDTKLIDLQGKMAMPGINDAHTHSWQGGFKLLYECNFHFTATPDEIAETIKGCIQANPDAQWIRGGQWTSDFFKNYDLGSPKKWLDAVSEDKAVYFQDDATHNAWVNSKALELAGIDKDTPDPKGGAFVRDEHGEPNGLVLETAKSVIEQYLPEWTLEQNVASLDAAVSHANSYGITGVNEARTPPEISLAYQQLDKQGLLSAYAITYLQTPRGRRDKPFDIGPMQVISEKYSSEHVYTKFAKMFLDGVPTASRTAVMMQPYLTDNEFPEVTTGNLLIEPEVLFQDLVELDRAGFTVKIHTAGDGAVRIALDAIEKMRTVNGSSGLRHQLAHVGFIEPDDLPRFAELNVTADLSPYLWFPSPLIESTIGAVGERALRYWPIKDLLASRTDVSIGSDWPSAVDTMNPWPAIEAMVTRKNPYSDSEETLWAEQAITLKQALKIFTLDGARAYRLEDLTGSIEVGKSAELIILEQNPFSVRPEDISDIKVEKTFFAGDVVYEKLTP
ncbi:MAG: amidohydrolase [Alphaproteobacteria bacterium]|nr:amidohydrolase [Alphaproteobacteria bacterium]